LQTLGELRQKIQNLEIERDRLMGEIERMSKAGEAKIAALEIEVKHLREETSALREVLGPSLKPLVSA
jgi:hypothetical protein